MIAVTKPDADFFIDYPGRHSGQNPLAARQLPGPSLLSDPMTTRHQER